ncbi:MAG: hypothetical protein K2O56_09805 [Muribaculaceae bacterium]|nr:hypothetical protein [Muribaculaceae bacterium]
MIIRKELFKEGRQADGTFPVVITISHNGKSRRVETSLYVRESAWNRTDALINDRERDYMVKNEILESIYRRVSGSIQSFIDTKLEESLDKLLEPFIKEEICDTKSEAAGTIHDITVNSDSEICFVHLVDRKADASVSHNTRRGYEGFRRYVEKRFGTGPEIGNINQDFTNRFVSAIDEDYGNSESMRRFMISRYNAVVNFGRDTGLIPQGVRIALPPYYLLPADRNLTGEEICNVFSAFNEAIRLDPDVTKKETEALGLFILDIAFQGLAPVDLANLKVKSLNFTTLYALEKNPRRYMEDEKYRREYDLPENRLKVVTLSTTRKKTGRPVVIVASTIGIEGFIRKLMAGKNDDDYLLSCFNPSVSYSASQRQNRLANYFNMMARNLNKAVSKYYRQHNLGESRRITFYFARHAFCNLVDSMDVPRHIIQNMVGHRSSVLETSYLRPITPWQQAQISHTLLSRYFL